MITGGIRDGIIKRLLGSLRLDFILCYSQDFIYQGIFVNHEYFGIITDPAMNILTQDWNWGIILE
jgi:hypothetical protein